MTGTFADRLRDGPPIVADGGMGMVLGAVVQGLRVPEEANLRAPDLVVSAHVSFINAGAELIETNSFGANRRKLAQHHLEDEFERINSAAVKLAREAREITGREVFIGASIGPAGEHAPGPFAEQARILEGRGADVLMLETFYDLEELEIAIEAVRSVSGLPIVALMSFDSDAVTMGGVTAGAAAERLRALGVDAFGANHGRGPAAALAALAEMAEDGSALAALPNVGLATFTGHAPRLPACDARVLRRVRGASACARRSADRRLLRHDARADRGDPRRRRREPHGAADGARCTTPPTPSSASKRSRPSSSDCWRPASSSSPCSSTRRSAAARPGSSSRRA